jgi:hypothetical protein
MNLFENAKNTNKQGDMGLGVAIGSFVKCGMTVSIPLTDSQDYDLIVDVDGMLDRVQVKTTSFKAKSGNYVVSLSVKGGNRTSKGTVKAFDSTKVDSVFATTSDGTKYWIPCTSINSAYNITLCEKYAEFIVD